MRYLIVLILVIVGIFHMAGAIEFNDNLQNSVEIYNNNLDKAPITIENLLKNEDVSIAISKDDGSLLRWGFETKNARIVSYALGGLKNPTIEVYATENAINDVLNAVDPVASYLNAEKAGNIEIKGKTLGSNLRLRTALINSDEIILFLGLINI
jgi:hypothetical protein